MNPGGESGWDEPPLDIQIPDDARELERDVLAYHRELRAKRRRRRLHTLTRPFGPPAESFDFGAICSAIPSWAKIFWICGPTMLPPAGEA